ncbi:MAG: hypothetical protein ACTHZX_12270 [Microbacterium sp.]
MLRRAHAAGVVLLAATLGGCATTPSGTAIADPPVVKVSLDGIASGDDAAGFDDGDGVLELLGDALGSTPEGEQYEGYPIVTHDWGDAALTLTGDADAHASIGVSAAEVDGSAFQTAEGGIAVGATREEALAAGAEGGGYDGDGDGEDDYLILEARDVPDAESLERPGEQGREFVMLAIEDDAVTGIHAPANDFSDL